MTLAIYIHWPFCISKCPYCDFNSHVGDIHDQEKWRQAYKQELSYYASFLSLQKVTSIFFGGGTPSLMEPATVESVIKNITTLWKVDENVEITLEANPSSAEAGKFLAFRNAGVNRLSLGVQSLKEDALKFLGRAHDVKEARQAIDLAGKTFSRFSFDLIYARQNQTPDQWKEELQEALDLAGDHLSLYQLTIEPYTLFHTRTRRGESLLAIEDDAATMYEMTQEIMAQTGRSAYEISNYAKPAQQSRHNLTYWRYEDYIGIGPGAHGRYHQNGVRFGSENHRAPDIWLTEVAEKGQGRKTNEVIQNNVAMREALMMGLRLTEGINLLQWEKKFSAPLVSILPAVRLEKLRSEDLIAWDLQSLKATAKGLQRLDGVLSYLA